MSEIEESSETSSERVLRYITRDVTTVLNNSKLPAHERYQKAANLFDAASSKGIPPHDLLQLTGLTEPPHTKANNLQQLKEAAHKMLEAPGEQKLRHGYQMRNVIDHILQSGITMEEIRDTYYPEAIKHYITQIAEKVKNNQKIDPEQEEQVQQMIENATNRGLSQELVDNIIIQVAQETGVARNSLLRQKIDKIQTGIGEFVHRKALKVKEVLGKLNRNDFVQLVEEDFKEHQQINKPIEKNELRTWGMESTGFDSQKIKVQNLNPETQNKLTDLIYRQQRAMTAARLSICRQLEFDPETPKDMLMRTVDRYARQYAFSQDERWNSEELIDRLKQNQQTTKMMRDEYQNDYTLVKKITSTQLSITAEVKVVIGPYGFEISVPETFINKVKQENNQIKTNADGTVLYIETIDKPPVYAILYTSKNSNQYILEKERQTIRMRLLKRNLAYNLDESKQSLTSSLVNSQEQTIAQVQDEILAMALERMYPDYDQLFNKNNNSDKQILLEGIKAFNSLIKAENLTREEAAAYFINIDIHLWPKTVERIAEARRQRQAKAA